MDRILTVNDVADILQVKPITVREMFREKRLRAFKVGKAWRTTEKMFQEDIDAMARNEKTPTLIEPKPSEAAPVKARTPHPATPKCAPKADSAPPDEKADDS